MCKLDNPQELMRIAEMKNKQNKRKSIDYSVFSSGDSNLTADAREGKRILQEKVLRNYAYN